MMQTTGFVRRDGRWGVSTEEYTFKEVLLANRVNLVLQTDAFGYQMPVATSQTCSSHCGALQIRASLHSLGTSGRELGFSAAAVSEGVYNHSINNVLKEKKIKEVMFLRVQLQQGLKSLKGGALCFSHAAPPTTSSRQGRFGVPSEYLHFLASHYSNINLGDLSHWEVQIFWSGRYIYLKREWRRQDSYSRYKAVLHM